jgi:hypothetical protein
MVEIEKVIDLKNLFQLMDYIRFHSIEEVFGSGIMVDEVELYREEIKKGLNNLVERYHNIESNDE